MGGLRFFFILSLLPLHLAAAEPLRIETHRTRSPWKTPHLQQNLQIELGLKRFARPGAPVILFIHGLSENDRLWDARPEQYSIARFFYRQGFDVWLGNLRGAGTGPFRSENPPDGNRHWAVEDYAELDLPALIDHVRTQTRQKPWIVAHSLAAWAFDGYFAGIARDAHDGTPYTQPALGLQRQNEVRGLITIAGLYNVWWSKSAMRAISDPIHSIDDYYASNYELELLAHTQPFYPLIRSLPVIPFGWIHRASKMHFSEIPWIGGMLELAYSQVKGQLMDSPLASLFFYPNNTDPKLVEQHCEDGVDQMSPRLLEQIANAVLHKRPLSYFAGELTRAAYDYSAVRPTLRLPLLVIGGSRDRLAHIGEVYRDGFERTLSPDKEFIAVEAGHLDIVSGYQAPQTVWEPMLRWIRARRG